MICLVKATFTYWIQLIIVVKAFYDSTKEESYRFQKINVILSKKATHNFQKANFILSKKQLIIFRKQILSFQKRHFILFKKNILSSSKKHFIVTKNNLIVFKHNSTTVIHAFQAILIITLCELNSTVLNVIHPNAIIEKSSKSFKLNSPRGFNKIHLTLLIIIF